MTGRTETEAVAIALVGGDVNWGMLGTSSRLDRLELARTAIDTLDRHRALVLARDLTGRGQDGCQGFADGK